jgi:hypothetical protein
VTAETDRTDIDALDPFVGTWSITTSFTPPGQKPPRAETSFEWLEGRRFLIQRWSVDHPDAPDGIAVIGIDNESGRCYQHYFDSRGEARVYEMSFTGGVWRLWRDHPGFFQRFTGTFDESGDTIAGGWESSQDGSAWEHDFDLTYTRESG